ncbi:hypothetical protein [Mongoliitalea daihaiensis]|uniref:hypothetical protein n=1 Tax=Mongoliitalea daihaiensis TaxID=2782006 RepID=UPI001F465AD9|nr:hypothetical protein [Mongoliitalea daihaiensis]UJP64413.1 hypothetical protein IPZ59_16630 [Mongoliitalea daihaiensis]
MIESIKTYILDILSIFIPGAILVAVLGQVPWLHEWFLTIGIHEYEGWINVGKFLVLIYILGHFLFSLGSFLDECVYDKFKDRIWPNNELQELIVAYKIHVTGIESGNVLNAFKWCCSWLLINQPPLYENMERHMAESKFFRSLVIVGIIGLVIFSIQSTYWLVALSVFVTIFSMIRYMTQRKKSVDMAYQSVITASHTEFEKFINHLDPKK